MRHESLRTLRTFVILALLLAGSIFEIPVRAQMTTNIFTNPHPTVYEGTIGFTFAGNKFVGSVQKDGTGVLYSTDLSGANIQVFAPGVSVPTGSLDSEHFVASSLGFGGFPRGDIYIPAGNSILHVSNDGTNSNVFVTGLASAVRAITFDVYGQFGYDMLVSTVGGQIYRANSSGTINSFASVGEDTEGMAIVPPDDAFGEHENQLIVLSEHSGSVRAVDVSGGMTILNPQNQMYGIEMVSFVPLNLGTSGSALEGLYASDYTPDVIKIDSGQFAPFKGDAIITNEFGNHEIYRLHWNGTGFEFSTIGYFPNQPEDGVFVTPAMIEMARANSCPLSQGFWKNHPDAWKVGSLMLGNRIYTKSQLLNTLDSAVRGDASLTLAHQLIAARLNIANGADAASVSVTIAAADNLLATLTGDLPFRVSSGSSTGVEMTRLSTILDNYNNNITVNSCRA